MAQQIEIVANLLMKVDNAEAGINKLKNSLSKLKMPSGLENSFKKSFANLDTIFAKYRSQVESGFKTKSDVSAFTKTSKELDAELNRISQSFTKLTGKSIDFKVNTQALIDAQNKLDKLVEAREKLSVNTLQMKIETSGKMGAADIENLLKKFEELAGTSTKAGEGASKALISLRSGNTTAAIAEVNQLINGYKNLGKAKKEAFETQVGSNVTGVFQQVLQAVKQLDTEFEVADGKIRQVQTDLENTKVNQVQKAGEAAQQAADAYEKEHSAINQANGALLEHASATQRAAEEVKQLQQSTQYFFGLRNMINLLKQGIREAVQTVKELDAAMTETAVVTDYSVSDMWSMLPQYTAQANELGATIQDMYESTTLYYQQGLETQAAMGIAAETMKMARIAGLEAKDATDMMTAALRGFNMELSNTSAQRINDVYSNLAAKTASDTNELGKAMQRTASIAYSAGMSFEGTAAFLAQAIETTREPAENIGTAMKTIVARFQEMKENPLEIAEVDGEEVSYNKVDKALQSIGVSLKDTNGQFRELDKVFLDISQRWNGLTQTQQRYIATIAAGSRQQSRFIAMMNNYDRTVELMGYANDSEGASAEQFGKTLESLQAKINEFQNAWKEFLMGIMNDTWTKRLVDGGTKVLNIVNKIVNLLSFNGKLGLVKSGLSIFTAFTALKGVGRFANKAIGGLGGLIDPTSTGKAGWRNGAIGNGKNLAQAQAISNPIVQAIHQLQAAITGKQASSTGDNGVTDYKASLRKFREESKKEGATVSGAFGTLKGLSGQQMQYISRSNAGRMSQIQRSLADTDLGKTISAQLMTAIGRGQISGNQIANLNKANLGKILGTEDAKTYSDNFSKTIKSDMLPKWEQAQKEVANKIRLQARYKDPEMWSQIERIGGDKVAHEDLIRKYNYDKETGVVTENPLYNEKYTKAFKENIKTIQESNKKLADIGNVQIKPPKALETIKQGISQIGGSAITAGQGLSALGSTLNSMGFEAAGMAVSTFGNALTNLGMIATGLPKLLSMIASPAGMAIGAIATVIFLANKKVQDAKKAAEKTIKDYEEAIDKANKKASTLNSAKDVFTQLRNGVDEHNNNIGLSTEEYDQYLATAQEVAEIAPELIRGYDAQGRAIIDTGSALDALIKKQEEYKEEAAKAFTSNTSINDIVGGIQVSDAFKKINKTSSVYDPNEGIYKNIPEQARKLEKALSKAGITNFDKISKQLFGHEINLLEPSNEDLHLISAHYDDIYKLLESENSELTEKQKENLQNVLSEIGTEWGDAEGEIQPLTQAIGQYLSSLGIDTIGLGLGEEFTESFNKGLNSLAMTAALEGWEAPQIKDAAREYAEGFKEMTQDGSKYATIMEQVTAKQEEFNESIGEASAVENYQNAIEEYAIQLEKLADEYDDGTVAGELFANSLREQAGNIRNYATETTVTLGEALNTLSDEFESARGVKERFDKAMEKGDYYTAAEGFKSIADTVLDDKNKGGNGSIAGWTGAEELLGQNYVDTHSWSQIVKQVEKVSKAFEDGLPGVQKFGDLLVENADKLKGLGKVNKETGQFEFNFKNLDNLKEYADVLGMSEDALAALIDKSRQWVAWDLSNPKQVRQALEQSNQTMSGVTKNGRNMLYTSETAFRQEAHQQGIYGDDLSRTQKDLYDNGNVRFLTVENLTTKKGNGLYADTVLKNIGLKGADKTLDNAVAAFAKMGFDLEETKQILTADGIKLADGKVTEEQVEQAYNENAYALENPTVAEISDNTGTLVDNTSAMLTAMGILTEDAKKDIDKATSEETTQGYIDKLQNASNPTERTEARTAMEDKVSEYNALANKLIESGRSETDPYVQKLRGAAEVLQTELDTEAKNWNDKIVAANQFLAENNIIPQNATTEEQTAIQTYAVNLQDAIETGDANTVIETLKQIETEGNLSIETMIALGQSVSNLGAVDSSSILQFISEYYEKLKLAKEQSNQPFKIETQFTGEKLEDHISAVKEFSTQEYAFLIRADVSGDEKVSTLINSINQEFGKGDEVTKTILIDAIAKTTNGDEKGAHSLLVEAFGEDTTETIEKKIDVLCDGSIANKDDVIKALEGELEGITLDSDVKVNATASINSLKTTGKTLNYSASVNTNAIDEAKKKADETTGTIKIKGNNEEALASANSAVAKINRKEATLDVYMNQAGSWKATVTVEKDARGRNYSIPASHSFSFGSAAQGMNIPKPKKTGGSQVTALVGEEGFEVGYIPSEQRSVIFGANGPEMTSFPSDTIIYPHDKSKEILRRGKGKHQSGGSFQDGNTGSSGGIPTSKNPGSYGGGNSYKKVITNTADSVKKSVTTAAVKVGKVSVWWENIARQTEAVQRKADKAYTQFEKYIKTMQATLKTTGTKGGGNDYIKNTSNVLGYNQAQYNKANSALASLDTSKKKTKIKYKQGKKEKSSKFKLGDYITKDSNGTIIIDQKEINKLGKNKSKGGKAAAEAVKAEAEKRINDNLSKRNKAEDAINKAKEALDKFGEELYNTFFAWEISLNEIWELTQKIEDAQKKITRTDTMTKLLDSQISSGMRKADESTRQEGLTLFQQRLAEQNKIISDRRTAIEESRKAIIKAQTNQDEKAELAYIEEQLKKNLSDTERAGYEQARNETLNKLRAISMAKEFGSVTNNADGTVVIDFNEEKLDQARLNGKVDETLAKFIEDYYTKLSEASADLDNTINSLGEDVVEYYDSLTSLQDDWVSYEEQLIQITEESNKKQIEQVKKMSDSIKKTMDDLLNSVKKTLDERRKQEDNKKTEEDISRKQQRLAALRADTSGGHQVEIAQLEKEIADAQQTYQRSLEDQLIEKLQNQADEAEKQRERQIALQEELATSVNNIAKVNELMIALNSGNLIEEQTAQIKQELLELYRDSNGYEEKGIFGKEKIDRDFENFYQGLITNQQKQQELITSIEDATEAINELKQNQSNSQKPSNSPKEDSIENVKSLHDNYGWSYRDLRDERGYTNAKDYYDAGVAYDDVKDLFSAKALSDAGYKIPGATSTQSTVKTYKQVLEELKKKSDKQLTYNDITALKKAANKEGITAKTYLPALAKGSPTWKKILSLLKGKWNAQRLAITFNSSPFKKAYDEVYGKGKYASNLAKAKKNKVKSYETGGLADYTGPAWLDGTPSRPELVLNATDTKNFIALRDILSKVVRMADSSEGQYGNATYEININVDKIASDYDVDKMAERVKKIIIKDSSYRNVTQVRKFR